MRQEKEKHAEHVKQLNNEMENLKELLRTYEISIGRKDEVVLQFQSSIVISLEKKTKPFLPCLFEQPNSCYN